MKLGSYCITYNEEARIGAYLSHALAWSDEVTIFDKGSTDNTVSIAKSRGARVVPITFSPPGHEQHNLLVKACHADWVFLCTPSSIPTKQLIEKVRRFINKSESIEFDAIEVARRTYSFGQDIQGGPWGVCYIPCIMRRCSDALSDKIHHCVTPAARVSRIAYSDSTYVLHQTHPSAQSFLESHVSYARKVASEDPEQALSESTRTLRKWRFRLPLRIRSPLQYHAWRMYHHSICLAAVESMANKDIKSEYLKRLECYTKDISEDSE